MVLLRQEIGDVLRDARREQGRTLREVSSVARVSLGYLSEVERGQKEASSELLASICGALEVPLSSVLHQVSERVAQAEGTRVHPVGDLRMDDIRVDAVTVPDTVPSDLEDLPARADAETGPVDALERPVRLRGNGLVSAA